MGIQTHTFMWVRTQKTFIGIKTHTFMWVQTQKTFIWSQNVHFHKDWTKSSTQTFRGSITHTFIGSQIIVEVVNTHTFIVSQNTHTFIWSNAQTIVQTTGCLKKKGNIGHYKHLMSVLLFCSVP